MKFPILIILFAIAISCKESQYAMHIDNKFDDKEVVAAATPSLKPNIVAGNNGIIRDITKPDAFSTNRFTECSEYKAKMGTEVIMTKKVLDKARKVLNPYRNENKKDIETLRKIVMKELHSDIAKSLIDQEVSVFESNLDIVEQYVTAMITLLNDWYLVHFVNIKIEENQYVSFRAEGRVEDNQKRDPSRCIQFDSTLPEIVAYKLICKNKKNVLELAETENGLLKLTLNDKVYSSDISPKEIHHVANLKTYEISYEGDQALGHAEFSLTIDRKAGKLKKAQIAGSEQTENQKLSGLNCYKFE